MDKNEELPDAPKAVVDKTAAEPAEKDESFEARLDRCLTEFVEGLPLKSVGLSKTSIFRSDLRKALPGLKSAILEEVNKA